jgi:dTMP kinase
MGLFITLEGGEGCGKSTQSKLLFNRLKKLAIPVVLTHEPGVTALGKKITNLLKWSKNINISPTAELLLFNASRAQLLDELIIPSLDKGMVVICDRFTDSTLAYQGYGRGLDLASVREVNSTATGDLMPQIAILLDIPVEQGLARKEKEKADRFQSEQIAFHRRVRNGYLQLAKDEPERWLVIDAAKTKEEIAAIIWKKISGLLPR